MWLGCGVGNECGSRRRGWKRVGWELRPSGASQKNQARRFGNHHPPQKHPAPSHGLMRSWESCGGRGVGDEKNLGAPNASEDAPIRKESGSHLPSSNSQSASPALPSPNPDAESQNRAHPPGDWPGIGDRALTQRLCMADAA